MQGNNGEYLLVFGGQERKFKFGTAAFQLLKEVYTIDKVLQDPYDAPIKMMWAGLKVVSNYNNNLPTDFSIQTVIEWLDGLDTEIAQQLEEKAWEDLGFQLDLFAKRMNRMSTVVETNSALKQNKEMMMGVMKEVMKDLMKENLTGLKQEDTLD